MTRIKHHCFGPAAKRVAVEPPYRFHAATSIDHEEPSATARSFDARSQLAGHN